MFVPRRFLWTALMSLAWAGYSQAGPRPNILILFADDWGKIASCYAGLEASPSLHEIVQTPNIDRVAKRGVLFRQAFVTAPSCTPCRSSLLTGQYFWRTGLGAVLHGAKWDASIPSFPLQLRDAGYHIGKSYKVWSPGTPADAPFGGQQYAYQQAGGSFNTFSQTVAGQMEKGKDVESARDRILDQIDKNFLTFVDDRPSDQPFLYWFGPTNVHRSWARGSGLKQWGIDPDRLKGKLPAFLPDVPDVREDVADYLGEIQNFDLGVGRILEVLDHVGEADNTVIIISGDHGPPGFPRGKCNLYDFGVGVPLIIAGPGIPGGRVVDDLVNLTDLAPTIMELAGLEPLAVMTGKSLKNVLESTKEGHVDPDRTFVVTGRERHVGHARAENVPYPQRAIRTDQYLYIHNFEPDRWPMGDPYGISDDPSAPQSPNESDLINETYATFRDMDSSPTKAWLVLHRNEPSTRQAYRWSFVPRPREELYVLADDPNQVNNLAGDPQWESTRTTLKEQLFDELKRTGDSRVLDSPAVYEKPPFTDPPPGPKLRRTERIRGSQ